MDDNETEDEDEIIESRRTRRDSGKLHTRRHDLYRRILSESDSDEPESRNPRPVKEEEIEEIVNVESKSHRTLRIQSSSSNGEDDDKCGQSDKPIVERDLLLRSRKTPTRNDRFELFSCQVDNIGRYEKTPTKATPTIDYSKSSEYVTPRRSVRQKECLNRRGNYSLPDRLERLEEVTPPKTKRKNIRSSSVIRPTSLRKPVNNFIKEWNEYNSEKFVVGSYSSGSDDLDNFIVDDEVSTKKSKEKRKKIKSKKYEVSSETAHSVSQSDEDIQPITKKKKQNILDSDEDSARIGSESCPSSEDELAKEAKELAEFTSPVSSKRSGRDITKLRKKTRQKLEYLKKKREQSKLPLNKRTLKKNDDYWSSPYSDGSADTVASYQYGTDTELESGSDFVVSDGDDADYTCNAENNVANLNRRTDFLLGNTDKEVNVSKCSINYDKDHLISEHRIGELMTEEYSNICKNVDINSYTHMTYVTDFIDNIQNTKDTCFAKFLQKDQKHLVAEDRNKRTLLHLAAICGNGEHVSQLLKQGASSNVTDNFNMMPLMYAALFKHSVCYEALLKQCNLSICHSQMHKYFEGQGLLHFIVFSTVSDSDQERIDAQLSCVNITKKYSAKFYKKLLRKEDKSGLTPLMLAVKIGNIKVVKALMDGSDLGSFSSEFGGNALHFAVQHSENWVDNNKAECLRLLLPKLKDQIDDSDDNGFTPLMYAAELGSNKCVEALIEHNADLMCQDGQGTTSLHLAALSGSTDCVKSLLTHGHRVDCVDNNGWPPLLYANFQAHESCVAALMEADPKQIFILSNLLLNGDEFQRSKNRKVVESAIMGLANYDTYYTIFNDFVRKHPNLIEANDDGMFISLWRSILDFNNKINWFKRRIKSVPSRRAATTKSITIDRENVLGSLFLALNFYTPLSMRETPIAFKNEVAIGDGPKREFVSLFCKEIVKKEKRFFEVNSLQQYSPVGNAFYHEFTTKEQGNKLSKVSKNSAGLAEVTRRLRQLETIGKIIGSFVADSQYLSLVFTKSFIKQLLQLPIVHPDDLEYLDPQLYRSSVKYVIENDVEDLGLSFMYTTENPWDGTLLEINLEDKGDQQIVTNENKVKYVNKLSKFKIEVSTKKEVDAFCEGFYQEIPPDVLRIFTADDFALLINGVQKIDIGDLRTNTQYDDCSEADNEVRWFWKILNTLKQEERALLLKFWTGTPCVPVGGFKNMSGLGSTRGFTMTVNWYITDKIPTSATCFNGITLSRHSSEKELRDKLLIAIRHGSEGFSFIDKSRWLT